MNQSFSKDFGPFEGWIWLSAAGQGPLPRVAAVAASEALAWKVAPHLAPEDLHNKIPQRLKRLLGQLIGAPAEEIILGNSTTYGIHLLANGIPWKEGDEVLLVKGDFPASILPWLGLRTRGVIIRFIEPADSMPRVGEIEEQITPSTKLVCMSWVNSFTGHTVDVQEIGELCRSKDVLFVLNGSQAVGARPVDVSDMPIDAITSCGFKWLCGPYATGFCWMKPEVLESLEYNQAYWLAMQKGRDLNQMREYTLRDDLGAAAYDVFCTANFFNFVPWASSVEYFLTQGMDQIAAYDNSLVLRLIDGLDLERYKLISPKEEAARSTLVVLTHKNLERNQEILELLRQEKIVISLREGNLRISPHLYNTFDEINKLLSVLNSA